MRLGEQAVAREAETFVARQVELARLADLLAPDSGHRIGIVTGAAGAGKSALVREAGRRAERDGYTPVWIDTRELTTPRVLADVLEHAASLARPLLVVDSAEHLGPYEAQLREQELAALPDTTRVLLVSRRPVEAAWWTSTWAPSITSVPVGPLESGAAAAFLAARDVRDETEVATVTAWAEGHALSLTLACAVRRLTGRALDGLDLAALETDLLDQLTGHRLDGPGLVGTDRLVLAVAAIAPAVDAAMLRAVLPEQDGDAAERWLRALPFAERLGHRVTLHQRVRRLLAAQLRRAEPDVERDLRLRIIDHLTRARAGRPELVLDVREVLAPPQDHGVTPSQARASSWSCEPAVTADLTAVCRLLAGCDPAYVAWWVSWLTEAPQQVLVVRRQADSEDIVAATVWATGVDHRGLLAADPALAGWLEASTGWSGATLYNPATEVRVAPADRPAVVALLLASLVQRCGLPDFRRWVVPLNPPAPDPTHCGGTSDPRFDLVIGELRLPGHVIDYGPDGLVAAMREEALDALTHAGAEPGAAVGPAPAPCAAEVRDALRHCHDPVWLASSSLARGTDPVERAASARSALRDAVDQAFGDGPDARLQREVLVLGYLDAEANHARAMRTLHLSRTTYFRRLREATATLAAWLAVQG